MPRSLVRLLEELRGPGRDPPVSLRSQHLGTRCARGGHRHVLGAGPDATAAAAAAAGGGERRERRVLVATCERVGLRLRDVFEDAGEVRLRARGAIILGAGLVWSIQGGGPGSRENGLESCEGVLGN